MAWSRESRHKRGYGSRWVKLRERIMQRDLYLCRPCKDAGRTTAATEVHHVTAKAHGGTDDPSNLVAICQSCHLAATRQQTGRREIRRIGLDGYPLHPGEQTEGGQKRGNADPYPGTEAPVSFTRPQFRKRG